MSRILTQKEMERARKGLRFCYLCGAPFPCGPGWNKTLTREHVVPRSLLGEPPLADSDRWAVQLWVHQSCDAERKQARDNLTCAIQALHNTDPENWNQAILRLVGKKMKLHQLADGSTLPVITGIESAVAGVWDWIRGMHAALYGLFLPSQVVHEVMAPVPFFSSSRDEPVPDQLAMIDTMSRTVLSGLLGGELTDCWDGTTCWGGRMRYRCLWFDSTRRPDRWACFWAMTFPGVLEWSSRVSQHPTPWRGSYAITSKPEGASELTTDQIDAVNAYGRRTTLLANCLPPRSSLPAVRRVRV